MRLVHTASDLQTLTQKIYLRGGKVGFVPTMGALHEGHISLAKESRKENELTVVSIFVNPTQFGPNEDFSRYPRTLDADMALLEQEGVDVVYAPSVEEMYPAGITSEVAIHLTRLDKVLCGASRPGHFNGVMLVVAKLLHQVMPQRAYFGEKDFQQLTILRTMVRELSFPVEIIGCPILREKDGLAMSSRNRYLNDAEREQAIFLYNCLTTMRGVAMPGMSAPEMIQTVQEFLPRYPLVKLDYAEIVSSNDLQPVAILSQEDAPRAFIAAYLGKTRLIDNLPLL